ncbi:MAG: hypothetical protein KGI60_04530, partial [Patescibacteria group bacterium]|nr:hypothetical protein [Patescibacteria group bacterium]
ALQIIFWVSVFGVCFSGYLSYQELFASVPGGFTCPAPGAPGTVFGYPACVYGFFMYVIVAAVAGWGLMKSE